MSRRDQSHIKLPPPSWATTALDPAGVYLCMNRDEHGTSLKRKKLITARFVCNQWFKCRVAFLSQISWHTSLQTPSFFPSQPLPPFSSLTAVFSSIFCVGRSEIRGIEWHRTRSLSVFFLCKDTVHFVQRGLSLSNLSKVNHPPCLQTLQKKHFVLSSVVRREPRILICIRCISPTRYSIQTPNALKGAFNQIYFGSG